MYMLYVSQIGVYCCKVELHNFYRHTHNDFKTEVFLSVLYRICTTKTTRSESPRSLGGKWSEPLPWPEWVNSQTIIDYWKRLETRANGGSFKRDRAHTMFHLFKPLEPCGRPCKWTLWAHWTNPNGLYGERLWMSNPVAVLLRDKLAPSCHANLIATAPLPNPFLFLITFFFSLCKKDVPVFLSYSSNPTSSRSL